MRRKSKVNSLFTYREDNTKKQFDYDVELLHIGESYELKECLFLRLNVTSEPIVINYSIYFMDIPQIDGKLVVNMNVKEENINPYLLFEL